MVVTASRDERRLVAVALCQFEPEHIAVERERPIEIRDFQMHMSDPDSRVDRTRRQRLLA
jgi:hypothetical protein